MCMGLRQGLVHQAVLGDLNTMGHGIARLSRVHCTDILRFLSLGSYEAEVWQASVLSQMDPDYAGDLAPPGASGLSEGPSHDTQTCSQENAALTSTEGTPGDGAGHGGGGQDGPAAGTRGGGAGTSAGRPAARSGPSAASTRINQRLRRWGVSEAVCRNVLNPGAT